MMGPSARAQRVHSRPLRREGRSVILASATQTFLIGTNFFRAARLRILFQLALIGRSICSIDYPKQTKSTTVTNDALLPRLQLDER
jgi:hypothetical protein